MFFILEKCTEIVFQVGVRFFSYELILEVCPVLAPSSQRHQAFYLSRDSSHRTRLVSLIFFSCNMIASILSTHSSLPSVISLEALLTSSLALHTYASISTPTPTQVIQKIPLQQCRVSPTVPSPSP